MSWTLATRQAQRREVGGLFDKHGARLAGRHAVHDAADHAPPAAQPGRSPPARMTVTSGSSAAMSRAGASSADSSNTRRTLTRWCSGSPSRYRRRRSSTAAQRQAPAQRPWCEQAARAGSWASTARVSILRGSSGSGWHWHSTIYQNHRRSAAPIRPACPRRSRLAPGTRASRTSITRSTRSGQREVVASWRSL